MSRSVIAACLTFLVVLTAGLGSSARACGVADGREAAAVHCAEMPGHHTAPTPDDPSDGAEDAAACMALCALAGGMVSAAPPSGASTLIDWAPATHGIAPTRVPLSADLSTEDPPPRRFA